MTAAVQLLQWYVWFRHSRYVQERNCVFDAVHEFDARFFCDVILILISYFLCCSYCVGNLSCGYKVNPSKAQNDLQSDQKQNLT